jgi:hypothetical protein
MIKIYTFAHKRPDFLELQIKSFRKHIKDEYEFIVFNNATFDKNRIHFDQINTFCRNNNINCINILKDHNLVSDLYQYDSESVFNSEGEYTNAVIACAYPLCYAWKNHISKTDDMISIIDSDMFFINQFNITDHINNYDLTYMPQSRGSNGQVYYMWNGLLFMNLKNMPNKESVDWWCGYCEGEPVDVGGHTFYYLKKYQNDLRILQLNLHYVGEDPACNFSPANYEYFAVGDNKIVLHYRGGSNWDRKTPDYHFKKTEWLKSKLDI